MTQLFETSYSTPAELTAARHHLCDALDAARVAPDRAELAAIMASELMSNALRHTTTLRPTLVAHRRGDTLEVAVKDTGNGKPILRPLDSARSGGNGIRIVSAYADDWGTIIHDGVGKTVWFTLAV